MSYGDYPSTSLRAGSEQLTALTLALSLRERDKRGMADERTKPPYNQPSAVPAKYNWPTLLKKDGDDLFDHYRHMLESLQEALGSGLYCYTLPLS
jgi:type I restriction enzyme M protein